MKKGKSKGSKTPERSRLPVSLRMSAKTKQIVTEQAEANQLSQSAQIEALIERAVTYDKMLEAMNTTVAYIKRGKIEAAFREAGYIVVQRTASGGKVWGLATDFPQLQSKFIEQEDE